MAIKVGINGFGRIGRNIMRAAMAYDDIDIVAVNDLTDAGTLAHLLKYDSILGNLSADIKASGTKISVDGDEFEVLAGSRVVGGAGETLGLGDTELTALQRGGDVGAARHQLADTQQ